MIVIMIIMIIIAAVIIVLSSSQDDRLGFALVGLGRAGHFHLESLRRSDRTPERYRSGQHFWGRCEFHAFVDGGTFGGYSC